MKYAKFLMKNCYTDPYFTDVLKHGVLFYSDDFALFYNEVVKEFVGGIIEDRSNDQSLSGPALNIAVRQCWRMPRKAVLLTPRREPNPGRKT